MISATCNGIGDDLAYAFKIARLLLFGNLFIIFSRIGKWRMQTPGNAYMRKNAVLPSEIARKRSQPAAYQSHRLHDYCRADQSATLFSQIYY